MGDLLKLIIATILLGSSLRKYGAQFYQIQLPWTMTQTRSTITYLQKVLATQQNDTLRIWNYLGTGIRFSLSFGQGKVDFLIRLSSTTRPWCMICQNIILIPIDQPKSQPMVSLILFHLQNPLLKVKHYHITFSSFGYNKTTLFLHFLTTAIFVAI